MRRVTLMDVAQRAGVSRATASMVVRGTGRLRDETRARVQEVMAELGYTYHRGAANLRTHRSGLIGLLVTDISNPFFSAMTLGFEEELATRRYSTLVSDTFDDAERQWRLLQSLREYPVEAIAYTPAVDCELTPSRETFGVPVLALTRRPDSDIPWLTSDDRYGGEIVARHLHDVHGYRRFVYLGGPPRASVREDRVQGVVDVLRSSGGGASLVADIPGPVSVEGGLELVRGLLASEREFDAVVCHSDLIAYAVLAELRGRPMESRTGVVGFDGLATSQVFWPSVTSVVVGPHEVGRRAAQWLVGAIDGNETDLKLALKPHLEVRASCGCERPA